MVASLASGWTVATPIIAKEENELSEVGTNSIGHRISVLLSEVFCFSFFPFPKVFYMESCKYLDSFGQKHSRSDMLGDLCHVTSLLVQAIVPIRILAMEPRCPSLNQT